MKYCTQCILPDTRPGLLIYSDGICNACKSSFEKKNIINWTERKKAFKEVLKNSKLKSKGYDCIIPVSGGKDSTWQVVKCLSYGLNPLAVTWKTPARTRIGEKNLENLIKLGIDHIDYQINPKVERKFMLKSLKSYGTTALPMHMALFNIPLSIASKFNIPLIIYGENSAFEYGGDDEDKGFLLDENWLKKYGVTHGTSAQDWISDDLSKKDLTPYFGPSSDQLKNIRAIFLGYYFNWDPQETLSVAQKNGFKVRTKGAKVGYYNYADIDCDFISIHHYIKWYKFGMTRLFDNLSLEIRNDRLSRDEALNILKKIGSQKPVNDIKKFCDFVHIDEEEFYAIIEKFRNKDIWKQKHNGIWHIEDFIINDWEWKE